MRKKKNLWVQGPAVFFFRLFLFRVDFLCVLKLQFVANSIIKGSLDEKLPIYEQDPKSKRLDSFEKRFVRDYLDDLEFSNYIAGLDYLAI